MSKTLEVAKVIHKALAKETHTKGDWPADGCGICLGAAKAAIKFMKRKPRRSNAR